MKFKMLENVHSTARACAINGKFDLVFNNHVVLSRINGVWVEDLQFFHTVATHFRESYSSILEIFIEYRTELLNKLTD